MSSFRLSESINFANENGCLLYVCFLDVKKMRLTMYGMTAYVINYTILA